MAEFGRLPEAVETTAVSELDQELQATHMGDLGPFLNDWLIKKVSAKFSPSISVSKLRNRLQASHGLGKGHQDTLFITSADFDAIGARLADENESWKTVDAWASAYMAVRGLQRVVQARISSPLLAPLAGRKRQT